MSGPLRRCNESMRRPTSFHNEQPGVNKWDV
jgi:hypothetical protein